MGGDRSPSRRVRAHHGVVGQHHEACHGQRRVDFTVAEDLPCEGREGVAQEGGFRGAEVPR